MTESPDPNKDQKEAVSHKVPPPEQRQSRAMKQPTAVSKLPGFGYRPQSRSTYGRSETVTRPKVDVKTQETEPVTRLEADVKTPKNLGSAKCQERLDRVSPAPFKAKPTVKRNGKHGSQTKGKSDKLKYQRGRNS